MRFTPKQHLDVTRALLEILRNPSLTSNEKAVLGEILYRCFNKDHCWTQQKVISAATGIARPNVARAIASLIDKKLVEKSTSDGKLKYYVMSNLCYIPASKRRSEWVKMCI